MVEVAGKLAATDKGQESWEISEFESWSSHQNEVTEKFVASRNLQLIQRVLKLEAEVATYFSYVSSTSTSNERKSTRSYERFVAEVQQMSWMTSTWTTLYAENSWMSHFKPQFIFVELFLGESTINQESTPAVRETVIPSDWKVDHGSDRNRWSDHDSLRTAYVEINDTIMLRLRMPKPTSFPNP